MIKLEFDEREIRSRIDRVAKDLVSASDSLKTVTDRRETIYKEISESAKTDALHEIASRIAVEEAKYSASLTIANASASRVDQLNSEELKMQKSVSLAGLKLKRVQTLFKALQFSVSRYQAGDELSSGILSDETADEV